MSSRGDREILLGSKQRKVRENRRSMNHNYLFTVGGCTNNNRNNKTSVALNDVTLTTGAASAVLDAHEVAAVHVAVLVFAAAVSALSAVAAAASAFENLPANPVLRRWNAQLHQQRATNAPTETAA